MKKLTSSIAAALTLAACGAKEDPADTFRNAMPSSSAVQVEVPSATQTAPTGIAVSASPESAAVPSYGSDYAVFSYWTAVTLNGGIWRTLEFLRFITLFPPTSCGDSSCTWGPWRADDGLLVWKLYVEKNGDHFDYALSDRAAADPQAPWVVFIAGTAFPGADRFHGKGHFTVDFDSQDALPHPMDWVKRDYGTLTVNYDRTSAVHVDATFVNALNQDPTPARWHHGMNAAYVFDRAAGVGGELQIGFRDLTTTETIALRTRWTSTGAGRGDAHYLKPNADPNLVVEYFASECWAGEALSFALTYDTDPPYGSEGQCAFAPAEYADVTIP